MKKGERAKLLMSVVEDPRRISSVSHSAHDAVLRDLLRKGGVPSYAVPVRIVGYSRCRGLLVYLIGSACRNGHVDALVTALIEVPHSRDEFGYFQGLAVDKAVIRLLAHANEHNVKAWMRQVIASVGTDDAHWLSCVPSPLRGYWAARVKHFVDQGDLKRAYEAIIEAGRDIRDAKTDEVVRKAWVPLAVLVDLTNVLWRVHVRWRVFPRNYPPNNDRGAVAEFDGVRTTPGGGVARTRRSLEIADHEVWEKLVDDENALTTEGLRLRALAIYYQRQRLRTLRG